MLSNFSHSPGLQQSRTTGRALCPVAPPRRHRSQSCERGQGSQVVRDHSIALEMHRHQNQEQQRRRRSDEEERDDADERRGRIGSFETRLRREFSSEDLKSRAAAAGSEDGRTVISANTSARVAPAQHRYSNLEINSRVHCTEADSLWPLFGTTAAPERNVWRSAEADFHTNDSRRRQRSRSPTVQHKNPSHQELSRSGGQEMAPPVRAKETEAHSSGGGGHSMSRLTPDYRPSADYRNANCAARGGGGGGGLADRVAETTFSDHFDQYSSSLRRRRSDVTSDVKKEQQKKKKSEEEEQESKGVAEEEPHRRQRTDTWTASERAVARKASLPLSYSLQRKGTTCEAEDVERDEEERDATKGRHQMEWSREKVSSMSHMARQLRNGSLEGRGQSAEQWSRRGEKKISFNCCLLVLIACLNILLFSLFFWLFTQHNTTANE